MLHVTVTYVIVVLFTTAFSLVTKERDGRRGKSCVRQLCLEELDSNEKACCKIALVPLLGTLLSRSDRALTYRVYTQ